MTIAERLYVFMVTVKALQGLWTNDLVALKGCCPNCSEEVGPFFLLH